MVKTVLVRSGSWSDIKGDFSNQVPEFNKINYLLTISLLITPFGW
jgi:hypothetical protein